MQRDRIDMSVVVPWCIFAARGQVWRSRTARHATAILVALAGVLLPAADVAQCATDTLRVEDVIMDVVRHNDRAAAMRYMEEAARARIEPSGTWSDPTLMIGVSNLPTSFRFDEDMMTMKMIGLRQQIHYAGETGLQRRRAQAEADAAREQRRGTEVDLAAAARVAYADLYYRGRTLADLQSQRTLLLEVVQSVRVRLATNQAEQEDIAAAESDLWRLDAEILAVEQDVDESWYELNALRGVDANSPLPPLVAPADDVPPTVDTWLADARAHYPPLQRLRYEAAGREFAAAAARRMRWPMLELEADYGQRDDSGMERRGDMVGFQVMLSLPFFAGRQHGKTARSLEAMRLSSEAEASQLWRDVEAGLRTLHRRAERLRASVSLYRERIIPAAGDAFAGALAGYNVNRTSFITLISYAVAIYRDRLMANSVANDLARTLAAAARYTTDPQTLARESVD